MLTGLEIADFHFSPGRLIDNLKNADAIEAAQVKHKPDYMVAAGDMNDSHLYATNKGGYNELRGICDRWASHCPIGVVEGTPSHDGPGCYDGLPVTVFRPGHVYGLFDGHDSFIDITEHSKSPGGLKAIFFGFPEANKKNIVAKYGFSDEKANMTAEAALEAYLMHWVAVQRQKFYEVPAIAVFHGNITDKEQREAEKDIILKTSEILARSAWFYSAGITRIVAGHIHQPNDLYVGSWGASFKELGFTPKFNLVQFYDDTALVKNASSVTHIPYGTPMRLKITDPSQATDPKKAYWLETSDPDAKLPNNVHPWSRVTLKENTRVTRRVTEEEAQNAKTLWDLALLLDPKTDPDLKPFFDEIALQVPEPARHNAYIRLAYIEIVGCKLFGGKTVKLDFEKMPGMFGLSNPEKTSNGSGKSSLASMCHFYPNIIGKDTKSNRDSAIQCFFEGQEAYIKKVIYKNDERHEHQINIAKVHTKNPKVECYLTVDGVAKLETCSFDEMKDECEKLYGPMEDYKATSFYEQPHQSAKQQSGLMTAKRTEARDVVLNIAGINREAEKEYAQAKAKAYREEAEPLTAQIELLQEENVDDAEQRVQNCLSDHHEAQTRSDQASINVRNQQDAVNKVSAAWEQELKKKQDAEKLKDDLAKTNEQKEIAEREIKEVEQLVSQVPTLQSKLDDDDKAQAKQREIEKAEAEYKKKKADVDTANAALEGEYNSAVAKEQAEHTKKLEAARVKNNALKDDYDNSVNLERQQFNSDQQKVINRNAKAKQDYLDEVQRVNGLIQARNSAAQDIQRAKSTIQSITDPCESCGHIHGDIQIQIDSLNETIQNRQAIVDTSIPDMPTEPHQEPVKEYVCTIPEPEYVRVAPFEAATKKPDYAPTPPPPFFDQVTVMSKMERDQIQSMINRADSSQQIIDEKKKTVEIFMKNCVAIQQSIDAIQINWDLNKAKTDQEEVLSVLINEEKECEARERAAFQELSRAKASLEKAVESLEKAADFIKKRDKALRLAGIWTDIADKYLAASKIPSLELDMVTGAIDGTATRTVHPYKDGIYSFRTSTQEMGKNDLVDKFDIFIHNALTGKEMSIFEFSPGVKAFFSDSYIKALTQKRKEKTGISYSPIISDEADGPIEPPLVPDYYEIQRNYYTGDEKVLIITHAPTAHNYIETMVMMDDLKGVA